MNWLNRVKVWLGLDQESKNERSDIYIQQIARDKHGKWVSDNEGKLVYKNDDPERIEKFTRLQEEQDEKRIEEFNRILESKVLEDEKCGDNCKCKDSKEIKIEDKPKTVKKPTAKKATTPPPAPTKSGTKKKPTPPKPNKI